MAQGGASSPGDQGRVLFEAMMSELHKARRDSETLRVYGLIAVAVLAPALVLIASGFDDPNISGLLMTGICSGLAALWSARSLILEPRGIRRPPASD
jgi:hypothetical protein